MSVGHRCTRIHISTHDLLVVNLRLLLQFLHALLNLCLQINVLFMIFLTRIPCLGKFKRVVADANALHLDIHAKAVLPRSPYELHILLLAKMESGTL